MLTIKTETSTNLVAEGHRVNLVDIKREAQKLSDKYKMKYASKKDEEEIRWW